KRGKIINHIRLVTNNQRAQRFGQVQTNVCKKIPSMWIYKMLLKDQHQDSNMVSHCSTSMARQCLTLPSRQEAVLSLWYGHSY
ncbi:hypothetical protein ACHAWX_000903, partial [Stephanocyclus meneghinianus]